MSRGGLRLDRRWAIGALCAAAVVPSIAFDASTAAADMVPSPADDCPPGSAGDSCHGARYCRLLGCSKDGPCPPGTKCQDVGLCLGTAQCGPTYYSDGGFWMVTTVEGLCAEDGSCPQGQTCELHPGCVVPAPPSQGGSPPSAEPADADEGCGCYVPGYRSERSAPFFLLAWVGLVASARRKRRR